MIAIDGSLEKHATQGKSPRRRKKQRAAASQEIIGPAARCAGNRALVVRHGGEDGELGIQVLAKVHDAGDITTAVAVIWRRPHGHDRLVSEVPLPAR